MRFDVLTIFPDYLKGPISIGLLGKALHKSLIEINLVNIRDFASDPHHRTDDEIYGGGAGMVMKPEPIAAALDHVFLKYPSKPHAIYLSPQGNPLTQPKVKELSQYSNLVLLCGRYEGVDARVIDGYVDEEISIGDYVLMGGEVAALVMIECVARYVPGVVGKSESVANESFENNRLESPNFTRPRVFQGREVPSVLTSGDHKKIENWRKQEAISKTLRNRPDLLEK